MPRPFFAPRRPPTRLPRVDKEVAIALNKDRIGHRYPAFRYEVCREKIREYAEATGITDPSYAADPADVPLSDVIAPVTFAAHFALTRGAAALVDPELGVHANLVHGSQEFAYARPIRGGDVLECTPRIVDIVDRERMELLTFGVECVDFRTKEPVVTAMSTIIFFTSADEA